PRALEQLLEVLAVDVLEDDVLPAAVLAAVDHGHDVRVRELGDGARLPPEALDVLVVVDVVGVEDLQRDPPLEQAVEGAVDPRHAAGADELLELVALGDYLTRHDLGRGGGWAGSHEDGTRKRPDGLRENRFDGLVPGPEPLVQLGVRDHERAEDADAVAVDARLHQEEAASERLFGDARRELRRRLLRLRVSDELDREHRAEAADVADSRMPLLPRRHPAPDGLADALGPLRESLVLVDVEDGERRRLRDRIADIRAADGVVARRVHDLRAADHRREREPARDRLRDGDEIRLDPEVLHREHAARAPVAALHLVGDEDDALP